MLVYQVKQRSWKKVKCWKSGNLSSCSAYETVGNQWKRDNSTHRKEDFK